MIIELYDEILAADAASFDVTGISGDYDHLEFVFQIRAAGASTQFFMRFNNDSGSNYEYRWNYDNTTFYESSQTRVYLWDGAGSAQTAQIGTSGRVWVPNYADTTWWKEFQAVITGTTAGNGIYSIAEMGRWHSTSAINRLTLYTGSGNLKAGSRLTIYGVKGETNQRISDLTDADPLDGSEYFVVAQGGQSRRVAASALRAPVVYAAVGTADATHNPDPVVNTTVDGMSISFDLDDTQDVIIHFSALATKSGGGAHIGFAIDGSQILPSSFYTFDPGESDRKVANCMFVAAGVAAGSHTATVTWTAMGNTNAITWKQRSMTLTVLPA